MKQALRLLKKLIVYPAAFLLVIAPLSPAYAQQDFSALNPKCVGSSAYGAQDVATIQGAECLIANILASAVTLIGIIAFVMFLVGGFRYLTSGANSKGVEAGANSISFAILGIVVALASFVILNVISNITGIKTILQFNTQIENIK